MRLQTLFILLSVSMATAGCMTNKGVNDIALSDTGQAYKVKFGTVLEQHAVNIKSSSDVGVGACALLGAGAGAGIGHSNSSTLGGMLAGAIAGAVVQNAMETGNGIEYMIAFNDGTTQVIDQVQASSDPVFQPGSPVMVQFGATRNRVLSAANLPDAVAHPKEVRVAGAPKPATTLKVSHCQKASIEGQARTTCTEQ